MLLQLVNVCTAFILFGFDVVGSASSCVQSMNKCIEILDNQLTSQQPFPTCREVAKFLNCIQVHCFDSLSPCEMNEARQWMLSKFDDTGIGCDSRKLLAPVGDCETYKSNPHHNSAQTLEHQVSPTNAALSTFKPYMFGSIYQSFSGTVISNRSFCEMNWVFYILVYGLFSLHRNLFGLR